MYIRQQNNKNSTVGNADHLVINTGGVSLNVYKEIDLYEHLLQSSLSKDDQLGSPQARMAAEHLSIAKAESERSGGEKQKISSELKRAADLIKDMSNLSHVYNGIDKLYHFLINCL